MKGLVLGAFVSALVVFIWGFLFWQVLPTSESAVRGVPDQPSLRAVLDQALPESGIYVMPYSSDSGDPQYQTLHTEGPIATIYIRKDGSEPMAPSTMVLGYLHEVLVLFVMGLMLKLSGLQSYGVRVGVVFLAGVAGSLFSQMAGPIWWLQPWGLAVMSMIYESFAWLFGGIALAAFVKPAGRRDSSEL